MRTTTLTLALPALLARPTLLGAQSPPCGLGPPGTTWRLVERAVQESRPSEATGATRRWLERVTVSGTGVAWRLEVVRSPLAPSGARDSLVVTARSRARAPEARVELPPCARLVAGATVRARLAESRDSITWRVGRTIDTLGVRAVELLADRDVVDSIAAQGTRLRSDSSGARSSAIGAAGVLAGTESRRRIVRLDDGMLLLDRIERRATGRLTGDAFLAGSASRTDRMEARPIAPQSVTAIPPATFADDSAIIATMSSNAGRAGWRRSGDTVELRTRTADGWPFAQRIVHASDGTVATVDDVAPLLDPPVVRWTVRDGRLVPDFDERRAFALPEGRPWGVATDGSLELLGPVLARQPADGAWHDFTVLVPARRGVQRTDVDLRVRNVAGHFVVHLRRPGLCPIVATLLFTGDWVPLATNVGGGFGETKFAAPGTARARALEEASRVVKQEELYPRVSEGEAQLGKC